MSIYKKINKNGFTIIELIVVVAIIAVLASIVIFNVNGYINKAKDAKRVGDLKQIQKALELYKMDHGGYPNTGGPPNWRSECAAWGSLAPNDVIPGITSSYLGSFPSDPSMDKANSQCCYLYTSDGTDFALLAHGCTKINYASQPSLIDPARDGGTNGCIVDGNGTNIWAWKISSPGGICW